MCSKPSIKPSNDCGLVGDESRLHQILSNLISNAIKFTEDGEIRVEINVRSSTDTTADLDICVSDTGIGIAKDARNSLFMPFLQGDGSTTRQHGGTGLGLAICKRLAEAMGGSISIADNLVDGRGTVFSLALHFDKEDLTHAASEPVLRAL